VANVNDHFLANNAKELSKLANERSRYHFALKLTWDALGVPLDVQDVWLAEIRGGNAMDVFAVEIAAEVSSPRLI
jgi:hypothetical protein